MSELGYLYWDNRWFKDAVYLDGTLMPHGFEQLRWEPSSGLRSRRTLAGTHVVQRLYLGSQAPTGRDAVVFSTPFLMADLTDERAIARARAKNAPVYFCPFLRLAEVFDATSGSSYKLSRPLASSVVSGVTSVTHPSIFWLDGTEDAAAATVSGSTLSALKTGQILIEYTPVFRVLVRVSQEVNDVNALVDSVELEEVIEV